MSGSFDANAFNRLPPSKAKEMLIEHLACCLARSSLDAYGCPQYRYNDVLRDVAPEAGSYLSKIVFECFELAQERFRARRD